MDWIAIFLIVLLLLLAWVAWKLYWWTPGYRNALVILLLIGVIAIAAITLLKQYGILSIP